jgi:hypothetical protein
MWAARRTGLRAGLSEQVTLTRDGRTVTFADVIAGWRDDHAFREFFIAELAATQFPAFFWETPPIRERRTDVQYEHVAIGSEALARLPPDPSAFGSVFRSRPTSVVTFRNLGGDAFLIAPTPVAGLRNYGHLASFVRSAPEHQCHELFRTLGRALARLLRICHGPLWTSTSGLGVPWLHIRLDSFPKYYNYRPYAEG